MFGIRRREFITLLGGAAVAWSLAARAQPGEKLRRVGILMPYPENEPDIQARVRAFKQELQGLGWSEGSKIEFDERWATDNMEVVRSNAASLLERKPDAVIAIGGRVIPILKQLTRSVPIVVAGTGDPLGTGLVTSLAHPGENITGFSLLELSIIGKFLELLKQMAPNVSRVSLIFNPDNPTNSLFQAGIRERRACARGRSYRRPYPWLGRCRACHRAAGSFAQWRPSVRAGCHGDRPTRTHRRARCAQSTACDLFGPDNGERRGSDVVRTRSARHISTSGLVYRPDTSRRKTWRSAGAATHQIRTRDKPQDCQDARP